MPTASVLAEPITVCIKIKLGQWLKKISMDYIVRLDVIFVRGWRGQVLTVILQKEASLKDSAQLNALQFNIQWTKNFSFLPVFYFSPFYLFFPMGFQVLSFTFERYAASVINVSNINGQTWISAEPCQVTAFLLIFVQFPGVKLIYWGKKCFSLFIVLSAAQCAL